MEGGELADRLGGLPQRRSVQQREDFAGRGLMDIAVAGSECSGIHTGWAPSAAFAFDELVIAPPDFSEEPSPPGKGSEPGDLPSLPNFDSSPELVKAKGEVGEESGAVEAQPEGATHVVSLESEPEENVGAGMSGAKAFPKAKAKDKPVPLPTETSSAGMSGTSPKPTVADLVSEALEDTAVREPAAALPLLHDLRRWSSPRLRQAGTAQRCLREGGDRGRRRTKRSILSSTVSSTPTT